LHLAFCTNNLEIAQRPECRVFVVDTIQYNTIFVYYELTERRSTRES